MIHPAKKKDLKQALDALTKHVDKLERELKMTKNSIFELRVHLILEEDN